MSIDPIPFTAEHFKGLIAAQDHFVTALIAVLPRAQRQALAQELTALANRTGDDKHLLTLDLLQAWAHRARRHGERARVDELAT